jgi:hypothetical protein
MVPVALFHAALAWLLPGLGHLVQGRRGKAAYFGGLVLLVYALGVWLGEGASVSSVRYPYHVLGQYWALVPALIASALGEAHVGHTVDRLELGVVYTTVAGIMNIIVMVDAYEWTRTAGACERDAPAPAAQKDASS